MTNTSINNFSTESLRKLRLGAKKVLWAKPRGRE